MLQRTCRTAAGLSVVLLALSAAAAAAPQPIPPTSADGRPLNLDFEDGTLKDWTATGDAFAGQPVKGDTVAPRKPGERSRHQGQYWIGGYEVKANPKADDATGTLTSVPFKVTHRWASFLVGGGHWPETRVELVRADTSDVFFKVSGEDREDLRPVVVDLEKQIGKDILVRLVDERKGGWGHVNFDHFAFYDERPAFPESAAKPKAGAGKSAAAPAPDADAIKFAGLPPEEAAKAMTLPPGFKATLFAGEPDIVQPIAFTIDARGRLWVAQGMTYPKRAPEGQGKDSILVFEDTDGDGRFDKRTVFAEGLNLVSGIEIGFGGVWVGAAPYLMFIPTDESADTPKPTGEPKILLDGFGYGDTHETLNTFTWGPDGWLYGCHGVFTQSLVGKPGTPVNQRIHINAGVWRYHPTKHVFERFAEGTSNPWGIDFDANGQCIIEACVIPHLWHIVQNGRYQRQAGQHDNPYTYDDIKTIADHVHWAGDKGPHAGNGRSDSAGGGHAHAGLLIYQGTNWPEEFRGKAFMNNIHGARLNMDVLEPQGSGFVGKHGKDFCLFNDSWSQIVNLRTGPDGGVYLIDWYDKNQCHSTDVNVHDRSNGRIFKITYGDVRRSNPALVTADDRTLASFTYQGDWRAQVARRLLQERAAAHPIDKDVVSGISWIAEKCGQPRSRLHSLWALHTIGQLTDDAALKGLTERTDEHSAENNWATVVAWTIQLLCEDGHPSGAVLERFVQLAKESKSPIIRLYLASAVQRIPLEKRADILAGLLSHSEDATDHNLPLMDWYGLESIAAAQPERAMAMAVGTSLPNLLTFTARRLAEGGPDTAAVAVAALATLDDEAKQLQLIAGLNAAYKGQKKPAAPKGWDAAEAKLTASHNPQVRSQANLLALTFGSIRATAAVRELMMDRAADAGARREALDRVVAAGDAAAVPKLRELLADDALRGPAIRGLAAFDDPQTPKALLDAYPKLAPAERKDTLVTLASRASFAKVLLNAVEGGAIDRKDLSADVLRQLRTLNDPALEKQVAAVGGVLRQSPAEKLQRIAELRAIVEAKGGKAPDRARGRVLFTATCAACHTLFDAGGKVGPDITGSNRADLAYLLENVVDPNALIPPDYQASILDLTDGRTIVGIVKQRDARTVTVLTQNETLTLPAGDVVKLKVSDLSMMPEGLLDHMSKDEVRDLIAYLRGAAQVALPPGAAGPAAQAPAAPAPPPVPLPQTPLAPIPADGKPPVLFNGKDLDGWDGAPGLWSVEDGEIVGRTKEGLKKNEFLKSKFAYGDFRLIVKIKLVPDKANSGLQFHSEPMPNSTEMRGPQADAGAGWWGKLYEESARGLLFPKKGEKFDGAPFVHEGEWNTYEVLAVGTKIRTAINGHVCTDLDDDKVAQRGVFGLQVHAGGPTEVRFKDFEFEPNPKFEMKTVGDK